MDTTLSENSMGLMEKDLSVLLLEMQTLYNEIIDLLDGDDDDNLRKFIKLLANFSSRYVLALYKANKNFYFIEGYRVLTNDFVKFFLEKNNINNNNINQYVSESKIIKYIKICNYVNDLFNSYVDELGDYFEEKTTKFVKVMIIIPFITQIFPISSDGSKKFEQKASKEQGRIINETIEKEVLSDDAKLLEELQESVQSILNRLRGEKKKYIPNFFESRLNVKIQEIENLSTLIRSPETTISLFTQILIEKLSDEKIKNHRNLLKRCLPSLFKPPLTVRELEAIHDNNLLKRAYPYVVARTLFRSVF